MLRSVWKTYRCCLLEELFLKLWNCYTVYLHGHKKEGVSELYCSQTSLLFEMKLPILSNGLQFNFCYGNFSDVRRDRLNHSFLLPVEKWINVIVALCSATGFNVVFIIVAFNHSQRVALFTGATTENLSTEINCQLLSI